MKASPSGSEFAKCREIELAFQYCTCNTQMLGIGIPRECDFERTGEVLQLHLRENRIVITRSPGGFNHSRRI